ncbi:MAG: hypothetical protein IT208_05515 [Chthonomonadales bacterium]|nr:hypothetical protein [Chthonomonadales bacterium]
MRLAPAHLVAVIGLFCCAAGAATRAPDDRMAAWHRAIVAINEARPNACLTTYVTERFTYMETHGLAKLVVGVRAGGKTLWPARASQVRVEDAPGAVRATWRVGGVRVRTEISALPWGRGAAGEEGGARLSVATEPAAPVEVRCGDGRVVDMAARPRAPWLQSDSVGADGDTAELAAGIALLHSAAHPFAVAVRASEPARVEVGDSGGKRAAISLPSGRGRVTVTFARDDARARALAARDPESARRELAAYYRQLLASRIETPEPVMDAAFRGALTTLEYNWLAPYGWVECIHHWLSLWHMQHSPAAEWLGQADRSRACLLSHADRLLPSGAVPQLSPGGATHRDFGGSNQFYLWQVRHYWLQTADRATARRLAPALDRVLAQTWEENDRDGDGLLAWGQQIGNQEDYVSTPHDGTSPSVEGIEMLRTRALVGRALGQTAVVERCEERARRLAASLRAALWQPDLGRYAFYRDPMGVVRPDGQYHTLLYPAVYGLLDPPDTWTSLRHMRDRLTGPDGEVYCSANFPWHAVGTWGMQAGEAQQPWAAWGLAAAGLREEAWRPLRAAAGWAMSPDHRGAWPEISVETAPAYFSPPAGLYVQSVVEALFGLRLDRPAGTLRVSPCLPDAWPSARLRLPGFQADYRRTGSTREYRVRSREALSREVRWWLPAGRVESFTVDGAPAPFRLSPGVGVVMLDARTSPSRDTRLAVRVRPPAWTLSAPASTAEGDRLTIRLRGAALEAVEDRGGLLSSLSVRAGRGGVVVRGRVRHGLLAPWLRFGRLGQAAFSRRTLFLRCRADGARFWAPVDLALLPAREVEAGPLERAGAGARVRVLVRNNSAAPLRGRALLRWAAGEAALTLRIGPRAQQEARLAVPADRLALLSPGENAARLVLPDGETLALTVEASAPLDDGGVLAEWRRGRMTPVALPAELLQDDTRWREWRPFPAAVHWPWANARPPLEALADRRETTVPGLPLVRFALAGRRLVPVSRHAGSPAVTLGAGGLLARKVYVLLVPLLDNHDTFTPVARVTLRGADGTTLTRTLHFPGDLDWWYPEKVVGQFATARGDRKDRHGLLPLLGVREGDWPHARAPDYPQPAWWATCLPFTTDSTVMNVVEMDPGRPMLLASVTVESIGADTALGIVALTVERASGHAALAGTPWTPPAALREPRPLFALRRPGDLEGWRVDGEAFSVAAVPALFETPSLNSLARAGERATGRAVSPAFTLDSPRLRFRLQGGRSAASSGAGELSLRLVDARTGATLARVEPPATHVPQETTLDVSRWQGRRARLEMIDACTESSYAWIGIDSVRLH